MMPLLNTTRPHADRTCDTVQQAHPGWLVFHNAQTGLWNAYRHVLSGKPTPKAVLLVRAESAEELDRKLTAQKPPLVPPSIRAVAAARALRAGRNGYRPPALRRLLRS
ncbi:hypothetical protein [Streptosporangium saharense]|uniref:hypothetical protein n=1 Tax=Streptosporangium saharense TaxID=1706840 RepID=UPI00369FAAAA